MLYQLPELKTPTLVTRTSLSDSSHLRPRLGPLFPQEVSGREMDVTELTYNPAEITFSLSRQTGTPDLEHWVPFPAPGPPRTKITLGLPITRLLKYGECEVSVTTDTVLLSDKQGNN